jgi:hypothetical protein
MWALKIYWLAASSWSLLNRLYAFINLPLLSHITLLVLYNCRLMQGYYLKSKLVSTQSTTASLISLCS